MLSAVPLCVLLRVAQAEVGADIDHGDARADERHAGLGASRVRQRREDEVDVTNLLADHEVVAGEVREHRRQRLARGAAPADADELRLRMRIQEPRQLSAGVPRDVYDAYLDHPTPPKRRKVGDTPSRPLPVNSARSGQAPTPPA